MRSLKLKIIPIIIILAGLTFFISYKKAIKRPLNIKEDVVINIKKGDSFYSVINSLSENKKIKGLPFIKLFVRFSGRDIEVKEGEYVLESNLTLNELIDKLTNGISLNTVKFTVPEGYTVEEIGKKLEDEGICSKEDFLISMKEYEVPSFVKVNNEKRYNLEGYLFPDTYLIKIGESPEDIIRKMVSRFKEILDIAMEETNTIILEDEIEDIITIASMIEKEARVDSERPIISSVIMNRLNINMMLQIDATIIYALGEHVGLVYESHLETNSPYNTYKNYGLPLGPISNPGLDSIKAALKPDDTDYLFYILVPGTNDHNFTISGEEFENLREKYGYNNL